MNNSNFNNNLNILRSAASNIEVETEDNGFGKLSTMITIEIEADALDKIKIINSVPYIPNKHTNKGISIADNVGREIADIKDVRIYDGRAVVMYFHDGTYTKAVCTQDDYDKGLFDVDTGIMICLLRKMFGDDGKNHSFKHLLNAVHKLMRDQEKDRNKRAADEDDHKLDIIEKERRKKEKIDKDIRLKKNIIKQAIIEAIKEDPSLVSSLNVKEEDENATGREDSNAN